jgi:ribonuclease-3
MIEELLKKLELSNSKLLKMSFTHSSFLNENFSNTNLESNERLEFLGDSVISYIVAEYIYEKYPNLTEGDMSKIRSLVVQRSSLANLTKDLDLHKHMILGKGEEKNNGRIKESNLCDLFESFIGCCALELGIETTKLFLLKHISYKIDSIVKKQKFNDPKSKLQELLQERKIPLPEYITELNNSGLFETNIIIDNKSYGKATGERKVDAEKSAAEKALNNFYIL